MFFDPPIVNTVMLFMVVSVKSKLAPLSFRSPLYARKDSFLHHTADPCCTAATQLRR